MNSDPPRCTAQPKPLHPSHHWAWKMPNEKRGFYCDRCNCDAYVAGGWPTIEAANVCGETDPFGEGKAKVKRKRRALLPFDEAKALAGDVKLPQRTKPTIATHGFEVKRKPRPL